MISKLVEIDGEAKITTRLACSAAVNQPLSPIASRSGYTI
jgi:hypothetical protein